MEDHHQVSVDVPSLSAPSQPARSPWLLASQFRYLAPAAATRLSRRVRSVGKILVIDWRTHKYVLFALLLLASTTAVVVAYYLNHPQLQVAGDTPGYLVVAQHIQTRGRLVDPLRLPGYPLLIVLVYALAGQDNLFAVSVAQAILFVLATLELYVLAALVLRRAWLAFLIGLLVGTNLTLLFYVKLIMSEALALWLLVSLALTVALFVYTLRVYTLWLVTTFTLALLLTQAEWIYLPVPLFTYLLLVAVRRGVARRLLPHALLALLLLYAILGDYIYINAQLYQFAGVAESQNTNAFGKVLQYDMQDEAPPQYAAIKQRVDFYLAQARGKHFDILAHEPSLKHNGFALAGEYAWAIIVRHPDEFLVKSVPLALWSLTDFEPAIQVWDVTGAFARPLVWLQSLFHFLYGSNICFPLCAALWLLLLGWRRTRRLRPVQAMGGVLLLTLYGLILTTLGGIDSYPRLHTPFNPLLILVVWGMLLSGVLLVVQQILRLSVGLVGRYAARENVPLAIAKLLRAVSSLLSAGTGLARGPLDKATEVSAPGAPSQSVRLRWLSAAQLRRLVLAVASRLSQGVRSIGSVLVEDWRTHRYVLFALLVLAITTTVVVAYYLNHPQPELEPDTGSYLAVAQLIQSRGQLVNAWRLPGYPLLIVLVYALGGQDNLFGVSVTQAILFVLATLELYVLAALVLRRAWLAFLIGLLVGTNLTLLFHVKLILSEALSLWLLVSLALTVALFVYTPRARTLWLVATLTLALLLTRAEWIYLPVPLFAYLLLVAARRGVARRLLPHALLALVLLYAILGDYIYINAQLNDFPGVVAIQNINAFGKVLQYDMQDEPPPQYATVRKMVDTYVTHGIKNPYVILHEPSLSRNYYALAGEYAQAIIARHPAEFLAKSVPLTLRSLTDLPPSFYYDLKVAPTDPFGVAPTGLFGTPLLWLESAFGYLYSLNSCFPLCAALWLLLLCRQRTRTLCSVQVMGAVVLLSIYGLILTTLGGFDDYQRLHIPFNPLLILLVWGTLLSGVLLVVRQEPRVLT